MGVSERIGILGGSFDPIHLGHLIAAEAAREQLGLSSILLIPARQSPLKAHHPGAPGPDRRRMIELAIAGHPRFGVSSIELDGSGQSYTVETLRAIAQQTDADLYFLMGYDQLRDLPQWRDPAALFQVAQIVGMSRPECLRPDLAALYRDFPAARDRLIVADVPAIEISSTDLRRRLAEGQSIDFRVPEAVRRYIQERGLYRGAK